MIDQVARTWVRVVIPGPLYQAYDYFYHGEHALVKGVRVRVPFGSRVCVGYVVELPAKPQIEEHLIKPIQEIIDIIPVWGSTLYDFIIQMSHYYHEPLGLCLQATTPKALHQGKTLPAEPILYSTTPVAQPVAPHVLNAEQAEVFKQLKAKMDVFNVHVLHGVTGSGKTEVYCHWIQEILKAGRQVLVLVPEIGLTPQMLERLQGLQVPVIEMHSMLTDKQRLHHYAFAMKAQPCIVVGTRSSLFMPLTKIGGIIVDEEHDLSYKQQNAPRYHARDMGVLRAKMHNIPIILGSATPSLETYHHAKQGRYGYSVLNYRASGSAMPAIHLIDMRQQRLDGGLSAPLIQAIKKHIAASGQVLLFLNRRGYAPVLLCHSCGWVASCTQCDSYYTLHLSPASLVCHHCGHQKKLQKKCGSCQDTQNLLPVGTGTEQIEEALKKLFPNEKVIRVDRDVVQKKGAMQTQLHDIHQGEVKLIVGTQMLAKGHHFPKLSMVGVVDIDASLFSSDFRSVERMAQLIVQVSGRAGRVGQESQGEVFIQTHQVDHPLLHQLLTQGYTELADTLLEQRQEVGLPPWNYLVQIRSESKTLQQALATLHQIGAQLKALMPTLQVLGPIPAVMSKKAGRYRAELMLQSAQRNLLHQALQYWIEHYAQQLNKKSKWAIDVDPYDLL